MDRMQKLGELLNTNRERKGISIREASNQTRIRESMIIALESGDYKIFNSDTHLKGFIKAYAKFLGLSEEKALAMYRRERSIIEDNPDQINQKASSSYNWGSRLKRILNWKLFTFLIGLGLVGVIVFFFYIQIQAFYRNPGLEIITPSQNQVLESDTFVIEGITDNSSVKVILDGNQANFIDTDGRFRVNGRFNQPGTKRFTIIAENQFQKRTEMNLDLTYRPTQVLVEKNKVRFFNNSNEEKVIRFTTDNKLVYDELLIRPLTSFETDFDSILGVKDFDPEKIDVYLNSSSSPLTSIRAQEFTIRIENSLPIITTE